MLAHVVPGEPKFKAPKSTVPLKSVSTLHMLLLSKQRVLAVDPQQAAPRNLRFSNTDTSLPSDSYETVDAMESHVTLFHELWSKLSKM